MQRVCKTCSIEQPLNSFSKHPKCALGYTWECKTCRNKKLSPYYKERRGARAKVENQKNQDRKDYFVEMFGRICFDCKVSYPNYIFDFHHIDPSEKDIKISSIRSLKDHRIKSELAKCVMLCSNCHRTRHYEESHATID